MVYLKYLIFEKYTPFTAFPYEIPQILSIFHYLLVSNHDYMS